MEKVFKSQFFYSFIAFLFALLLFFNANADGATRVTQSAQKYDTTVYDVPVQVDYDEKNYYVSGFPNTVTVHLSSINRVKLAQEAGKETRSFKVIADLTNQKEGTVDVMLRATNLISGVEAVIDPAVISITVEKKETKKFKVEPILNDDFLKEGYQVKEIKLSEDYVNVTTGKETMSQIATVQGKLSTEGNSVSNFKEEVVLQALDEKGNVLPVTIDPQRVTATVTTTAPEKKLSVKFQQSGEASSGVSSFQFESETKEVLASGPQSILDNMSALPLTVDVTGIKTKKELVIPATSPESQIILSPKTIKVTVIPIFKNEDSKDAEDNKGSSESKNSSSKETSKESTSQTSQSKETVSSESTTSTTSTGNKKE